MDSVFWEPDDTLSLRQTISRDPTIKEASVLEIGTGSGLISLCCLHAGAKQVVATDLNPAAVANARYNALQQQSSERLDVRLVPRRDARAWTVIRPEERFDLIVSNPPWENARPESVQQFALYDPGFELLESILSGARDHLNPDGRLWLAYGCKTAILKIEELAAVAGLTVRRLDDRSLDDLPELFLPGMLLELRPAKTRPEQNSATTM
jgi:methylase of polypeptide subunit release factors